MTRLHNDENSFILWVLDLLNQLYDISMFQTLENGAI